LWCEQVGRYLRSRPRAAVDHGRPALGSAPEATLPAAGAALGPSAGHDPVTDVSLLGLAWPFAVTDPRGERMCSTAAAVERALALADGGILRYEGDTYAGGNSWVLAVLWLGLYHRRAGGRERHRRCLEYAIAHQSALGLLPEQVGPDGRPAWVLPLAWSHAMLLLAAREDLALVQDPGTR
ncbi:MAG: glycoside hydrolase family 15 protein, partial [Thermoleophilaceae bacterium]